MKMRIKNTTENFGLLTRLLHWLIAISIILLIWLGWYMVDLTYYDKWYYKSLTWHKSLGMITLALAIIKIGWQFYSPPPDTSKSLKTWERLAATTMHKILIVMMILIPATGFLISTSEGKGVEVFNWFEVPALIAKNTTVRDWAIALHFYLAYAIVLLITGHAAAALKHQFIDKDGILKRIIWG